MLNQTTNTRFSKHRKENASAYALAQLADYEPSDCEEDDLADHMSLDGPRSRQGRVGSLDVDNQN